MSQVSMIKMPDIMSVALLVIAGEYGNGEDRKNKLASEGYDYNKVQGCVNDLIKIIDKYS